MAVTLDATVGGASANTYITLAAAETYFEARTSVAVWDAATTDEKNRALAHATRLLDAMYVWVNWEVDPDTQALRWPRNGVTAADDWTIIADTEIPPELTWAVCEMAFALLSGDRTLDSDIETQGLTRLKAGSVDMSFKESVTAKVVPDAVVNLIPSWWGYLTGAVSNTAPLLRA